MITVLADRNVEGQAEVLWGVLAAEGWLALTPMRLFTFEDVGLPANASDRTVWRFAQEQGMFLLTGNRNRKGRDSLEQTIAEESTPASLPVITIGNIDRLVETDYRAQSAERLVEVVLFAENYLGAGRIFIP